METNNKFTPGPWIAPHWSSNSVYTESGNSGVVAVCRSKHRSRQEQEANARLIAAAPNLLAACKRAVDFGLRDTSYCSNETDEVCAELEAAIAKATGQES